MASGIHVTDKVTETYNALSKRQFSAMVLSINPEMTEIIVEKTTPPTAGDPEAEWKEFVKTMPENDCRYIICDFQWKETPTVVKSKLCMILWSPEYSPIRSKMYEITPPSFSFPSPIFHTC